jgi:hypothetical protein
MHAPTAWPGENSELNGGKKFQSPVNAVKRPNRTRAMLITRLETSCFMYEAFLATVSSLRATEIASLEVDVSDPSDRGVHHPSPGSTGA